MSKIISKSTWAEAIGARKKPRRLHLVADKNGEYICPVESCDSYTYKSQRGCRKHVHIKHGWYYYFDTRPNIEEALPQALVINITNKKKTRSTTSSMPTFQKTCPVGVNFKNWLKSPGGGGKSDTHSDQIVCKFLKYLKFCCEDVSSDWNFPVTVSDYCLGSVNMISDFVKYLQEDWKVGYSGVIGYMNSLSHALDFRRITFTVANQNISASFVPSEIYVSRIKKCLSRKMRLEWNEVLSIDYLTSINCWLHLMNCKMLFLIMLIDLRK